MSNLVEDFLQNRGPCLSSEITSYIVQETKISPSAARQRVSRLLREQKPGGVRFLRYIKFPRRAQFVYLEQQFGSPFYWENLIETLMKTNTAYGNAIAALEQRGGIIPERLFLTICGAPIKQKKQLSSETVFNQLNKAGLLKLITVPDLGNCITIVQADNYYDNHGPLIRANLIAEDIVISAVKDWLRKLGIVSYDKVATRKIDSLPQVGTFTWDITAPSYLGPMVKTGNNGEIKPGFVVCDVNLTKNITANGIKPFIKKCQTLRNLRNIGPCLQIFLSHKFEDEAFNLLKKNGIIPATPKNIFGEEVAESLLELSSVLNKAATSATIDASEFDKLFKILGKIEGASKQLRGTLFEYLSADIMRKNGAQVVRLNRIYQSEDKKAEADVIAEKPDVSITFIECKGHNPFGITPHSEVKRWLQHNVPTLFKAKSNDQNWKNIPVRFEFWTTAPLSQESLDFLSQAKINTKRYTIHWRTSPDILTLCKQTNDKGLINACSKHFTKIGEKPSKNIVPVWPD